LLIGFVFCWILRRFLACACDCLSVCLAVCLSLSLIVFVFMSVCLSVCVCLPFALSLCRLVLICSVEVRLFVCLPVSLSVCVSVCLSVCLSGCLSFVTLCWSCMFVGPFTSYASGHLRVLKPWTPLSAFVNQPPGSRWHEWPKRSRVVGGGCGGPRSIEAQSIYWLHRCPLYTSRCQLQNQQARSQITHGVFHGVV
jgi:hypothetical protein